jgi:hypothetical protein
MGGSWLGFGGKENDRFERKRVGEGDGLGEAVVEENQFREVGSGGRAVAPFVKRDYGYSEGEAGGGGEAPAERVIEKAFQPAGCTPGSRAVGEAAAEVVEAPLKVRGGRAEAGAEQGVERRLRASGLRGGRRDHGLRFIARRREARAR